MTDPLIEAVARALAKAKGIEICSDATYSQSSFRAPALAAITAMREQLVPVGWMYECGSSRIIKDCQQPHFDGYSERLLYAFPAAPTEEPTP